MGDKRVDERAPLNDERHVLVTGFGPFGDVCINASGLLAERLDGAVLEANGGLCVRGEVLPTSYAEARERIADLGRAPGVATVLALGVWRGVDVKVERRARGVVTSEKRDVRGEVWKGRELGADRATRLALETWHVEGARVSEDCGGYVCNATYHALLGVRDEAAVFVHVPRDVSACGLAASEAIVRRVLARLCAHVSSGA